MVIPSEALFCTQNHLTSKKIASKATICHFLYYFCTIIMTKQRRSIELLAPARDAACARVAIDCGADAIYMGASSFGARKSAGNTLEDIASVVEYAHRYSVRVHATMNTVLYDDELAAAERQARALIDAGVDALIIQDMALRAMNLPIELHASTQVGIASAEDALFYEQCGFSRLILERALSLEQIRSIREATTAELECFIHGAICVGHSGRCFLSRTTSQRSGNRGECSQPCRLPYDLVDSSGRKILSGKHLLSVRDFNLSASLEELIDAGVSSFKIEGRLKDENYVRNVVSHYRRQLDSIIHRRNDLQPSSVGRSIVDFTPNPDKSFTRGASDYMLYGKRAGVASFDTPKSVGEYIGKVKSCTKTSFTINGRHDLSAGDGICIMSGEKIVGTNINIVEDERIIPNRMDGIVAGADLYRNYDHRFTLSLSRSRTRRIIDATASLTLHAEGIELTIGDCQGNSTTINRTLSLEPSSNPQKMADAATRAITKSGGTIFEITDVTISGSEWFAPASILSDMRREALEQLTTIRSGLRPSQKILADNDEARFPRSVVSRYENVTNHLSREFYLRHGAEEIEQPLEAQSTYGERVMLSSYCIRREIGECLREHPTLRGDLYIEHGTSRYKLSFDCERCLMSLYDHTEQNRR